MQVARDLRRNVIGYELEESLIPTIMEKVHWGRQALEEGPIEYEVVRRKPVEEAQALPAR